MGAAIVSLKWTPAQFWGATMHEFQAAVEFMPKMNPAPGERPKHGNGN